MLSLFVGNARDNVTISRIELLKMIDGLLGRLIAYSLPVSRGGVLVTEPRSLLVIRPGGIGDAVLLLPTLAALKGRFPEARITVLAERRNAAIFDLSPALDRLLLYDKPRELLTAVRGRYDLVIDSEQWHRLSAVVARLTMATTRIGYGTNERARLFTHPLSYRQDDYEALSFLRLLEPLGITPPATITVPFLVIPQETKKRAAALLAPLAGRDYLLLFPGASIPERRWGGERFEALARRLEGEGWSIVVVGGGEDVAAGALIAGDSGLNLAGESTLVETAAIIAGAQLLVSGDSGLLHLAVGLGIPTVSLFGPGRQEKWGPRGKGDAVINHQFTCSPCTTFGSTPECPLQARCMAEISVDELLHAALRRLREKSGIRNKPLDIIPLFR